MALQRESVPREFACTLLAAIIGDREAIFFQIGDGSIVVEDTEENGFTYVFWPERGEYENTTFFATEADYRQNLLFESVHRTVRKVSLFSDGIQRLALDYGRHIPHLPFFKGLFEPLKNAPEPADSLNDALKSFLSSEKVNERTDDDKTLILASRE